MGAWDLAPGDTENCRILKAARIMWRLGGEWRRKRNTLGALRPKRDDGVLVLPSSDNN